jgi:iron-sulfur cluster assembly protein
MLVLTEAAADAVKSVTSTAQVPDVAGLRIASSAPKPERPDALQLSAVAGPLEDDQVIEADGARVFVDPLAVTYLEDKVLDARVDEQGNSQFALGIQAAEEA